jgi:RNA polymerase sigma-70 factor, ECF subfamily
MSQTASPDTEQLLDLVVLGDVQARSLLLDRHRARLTKMIAVRFDPRLARRLDPSDVVQETLAEAAAGLTDYARIRPIPFYPWLRQLAGKILLRLHERHVMAKRRSVKREALAMPALPEKSADRLVSRLSGSRGSPADRLIAAERHARVRAALLRTRAGKFRLALMVSVHFILPASVCGTLGSSSGASK